MVKKKSSKTKLCGSNETFTGKPCQQMGYCRHHGQEQNNFTKKQEAFINASIDPKVKSKAEAARIAGIDKKNARNQAYRWMTNDDIFEEIEKRKSELAKLVNVTKEAVIGSAVRSAFATIDDAYDDSRYFSIEKARATGAIDLIKSIARSQTKYGESIKVEFYSAADARKELADYLGIKQFTRENEQNLKRTIAAIEDYLQSNPTSDRKWVIDEFARGREVPRDRLYSNFGIIVTDSDTLN